MESYEESYAHMTAWFRKKEFRTKALIVCNQFLTYLFYIAYPLLLIWIFLRERNFFMKALLVPAITFVILSLVRKGINRRRPYEQWHIDPLIHKNTIGKSMPSRHLFSSAVIAMVFLHVNPVIGFIALVLSLIDGFLRIIGGVHYPSDVIAGFASGVLAGLFLWI